MDNQELKPELKSAIDQAPIEKETAQTAELLKKEDDKSMQSNIDTETNKIPEGIKGEGKHLPAVKNLCTSHGWINAGDPVYENNPDFEYLKAKGLLVL